MDAGPRREVSSASMTPRCMAFFALALGILATSSLARVIRVDGLERLPPRVAARFVQRLEAAGSSVTAAREAEVVVALGGPLADQVLGAGARLSPEGFALRVGVVDGTPVLAVRGRSGEGSSVNRGLMYGAYAALQSLGYGFLHPLEPVVPTALRPVAAVRARREGPRWAHRALHLHTMHPTELADLVNGFGPGGAEDAAGWEAGLAEWELFLEWLVANRQNAVQWVLLDDPGWDGFGQSAARIARLKRLVDVAHGWGIHVGIDVPVALGQQNGFRLIRRDGPLEEQLAELEGRVDWLMQAGFDYVTTEWGSSEFTTPDEEKMLAWLDHLAIYLDEEYGAEATVKVHVTVAETSKKFRDPETGKKMNINFVPHYADPRLGVEVHTVQHYGLDDPAPTYGREDFADLHRFLQMEAGRRTVNWYPETAYWVSFDVDVPLFLPVYAERRLHDLRLIAADEAAGRLGRGEHAGATMDGQSIFSSGWEWGYWLNDVVAARGAWDPRVEAADDGEALRALLGEAFQCFGSSGPALADLVARTARMQHERLILARVEAPTGEIPAPAAGPLEVFGDDPVANPPLEHRWQSGQSYLQGVETWDDAMDLLDRIPFAPKVETQPPRLGPLSVKGRRASRRYVEVVRPLLAVMVGELEDAAAAFAALAPAVSGGARGLADELADAAEITALRGAQVWGLYDYASRYRRKEPEWKASRLATAAAALDQAAEVVARREAGYRVPVERIAGWRSGPTVYPFGYLWTVRSLFYWWRDEGKVRHRPRSVCYLNVLDPFEVSNAEGSGSSLAKRLQWIVDHLPVGDDWVRDCLEPPTEEPDLAAAVRGPRR